MKKLILKCLDGNSLLEMPMESQISSENPNDKLQILFKNINGVNTKYKDYNTFVNSFNNHINPLYNELIKNGFSKEEASAWLGNAMQESIMNTTYNDGSRIGPWHFLGDTKKHYMSLYNSINAPNMAKYVYTWSRGLFPKPNYKKDPHAPNYNYLSNKYLKVGTPEQISDSIFKYFERAGDNSAINRSKWARAFYNYFK